MRWANWLAGCLVSQMAGWTVGCWAVWWDGKMAEKAAAA